MKIWKNVVFDNEDGLEEPELKTHNGSDNEPFVVDDSFGSSLLHDSSFSPHSQNENRLSVSQRVPYLQAS